MYWGCGWCECIVTQYDTVSEHLQHIIQIHWEPLDQVQVRLINDNRQVVIRYQLVV